MANILVVLDVEKSIDEIRLCLEPRGHRLFIAHTVSGAINLLKAARFDLLICAVHLRRGVVFDLLKEVKSNPEMRRMPFIFFCRSPAVTATRLSTSLKKTAMLLGADKYITHKNFDEQRFLSEVNDFLKTTPSCTKDRK